MKFFAKSVLNRTTCLQSAVVAAALIGVAGPTAAFAQSAPAGASADEPEQVIVVTGSRISRPNIESAIPIASIGGEEFFQQGQNSVGDTLNDLPQLRSTFAQQNPGAGVGIAGLNLLD
ncbi:MAG TPA: TonB-dependent receptor, partial [Novosphingobium sp.]|nr:TonB-dependent receptor [Novosphingobium sp.]